MCNACGYTLVRMIIRVCVCCVLVSAVFTALYYCVSARAVCIVWQLFANGWACALTTLFTGIGGFAERSAVRTVARCAVISLRYAERRMQIYTNNERTLYRDKLFVH